MELDIRLLYFDGCPNAGPTLDLLRKVLEETDTAASIHEELVSSEEASVSSRFLGSPTVQVDGLDIEPARRTDSSFFGCRLYRSGGMVSGVPPADMIRRAISEATSARKRNSPTGDESALHQDRGT